MAAKLAKARRIALLLRALLGPGYVGVCPHYQRLRGTRILLSGRPEGAVLTLLSPGFASRLTDYEPLVRSLEQQGLVARLGHRGNGRGAGILALLRLWYLRLVRRLDLEPAARLVRGKIHSRTNCLARLEELLGVAKALQEQFPGKRLVLVGHSFGTDTVLRAALAIPVDTLILVSPHPPGYLIPRESYMELRTNRIVVMVGAKDWTSDGVGPHERLSVTGAVREEALLSIRALSGVGHMDFALMGLGPEGYIEEIERVMGGAIEHVPATSRGDRGL